MACRPISTKQAIPALIGVVTIGYYVFVKAGVLNGSVKHTLGFVKDDVRASHVVPENRTFPKHRTVQDGGDVGTHDNENDTFHEKVEDIGIEKGLVDLDSVGPRELMNRTVIVTAISQNHLTESKGMIGSVQEFLPNARIIIYDLGLNPSGVQEVQSLCSVELRKFNFSKYPPHAKKLHTYAWKPLIIRETLAEFGIIFWCDASARFRKDPLVLFSTLKEQHGFLRRIVEFKPDKMMVRTHPKMFEELGIDREKFRTDVGYAMCLEANRLLFVNSGPIQTNIIEPWVDCALRRACIAPKGSALSQHLAGPRRYTHRFDQAALSLLVYKNLRGVYNEGNDRSRLFHDVVGLSRSSAGSERAKFCKS